jgi:phage recombination protein Bet
MTSEFALERYHAPAPVLDDAAVDTLRKTLARDLGPDEFALFVAVARRLGLDPLTRQLYGFKSQGRLVLTIGLDGYRVLAARSGRYGGQLGPFYADATGKWSDLWLEAGPPAAAKVGVVRTDWREPLWAIARYKSYARESPNWKLQPEVMLAKCAEALALRKAFPQELGGAPEHDVDEEPAESREDWQVQADAEIAEEDRRAALGQPRQYVDSGTPGDELADFFSDKAAAEREEERAPNPQREEAIALFKRMQAFPAIFGAAELPEIDAPDAHWSQFIDRWRDKLEGVERRSKQVAAR